MDHIFAFTRPIIPSCLHTTYVNPMISVVSTQICIKKSSALSHTKNGEVSLQIEFATLPPINRDLFVKQEQKGNWKNKENAATS